MVTQLPEAVRLHDVADVDAFVACAVRANPVLARLEAADREVLQAEGLLVMCELARRFTPAHGRRGMSFSTYAGRNLPLRLISVWHGLRGHRRLRLAGGGREWSAGPEVGSWDQELERPGFSERGVRRVGEFVPIAA